MSLVARAACARAHVRIYGGSETPRPATFIVSVMESLIPDGILTL